MTYMRCFDFVTMYFCHFCLSAEFLTKVVENFVKFGKGIRLCTENNRLVVFLPARRYASAGIIRPRVFVCLSVCVSVCHTPVLRHFFQ